MGSHHPPVASLALTLILILGSPKASLAEGLIPDDIAYTPPPASDEQLTAKQPSPETLPDNPQETAFTTETQPLAVTATAQKTPPASCTQNQGLRKTLSISRFTRQNPQTANAGNLYEAEQGIAQLFQQYLQGHGLLRPELLLQGATNSSDEHQQQRSAQEIARRTGTQFVLLGSITDMSMNNPESLYNPGHYRRLANWFHDLSGIQTRDKRLRQFAINLVLRDGYTGETVFAEDYNTSGFWPLRTPVGFNSAKFRTSDYALQIDKLVKRASEDLAKTINCQPLILSVDAPAGRTQVTLAGGANHGLHAGDQLELYQLIVSPSNTGYMLAETRLIKRITRVQLTEVYPSHSTATIADGEYLNGAFLAVSD